MADSVLYLLRGVPGHDAGWREAVEMALTGAAFGVATTVWLARAPLAHLARRDDAGALIAELTGFGVRCVADRADLHDLAGDGSPADCPAGVEALDRDALAALRATSDTLIVL